MLAFHEGRWKCEQPFLLLIDWLLSLKSAWLPCLYMTVFLLNAIRISKLKELNFKPYSCKYGSDISDVMITLDRLVLLFPECHVSVTWSSGIRGLQTVCISLCSWLTRIYSSRITYFICKFFIRLFPSDLVTHLQFIAHSGHSAHWLASPDYTSCLSSVLLKTLQYLKLCNPFLTLFTIKISFCMCPCLV